MLELDSLQKAIIQLEDALSLLQSDLPKREPQVKVHLQAAAIQAFEFTYELTYKMLKRYLKATEPNAEEVEGLSFNDLIRLAFDHGLVKDELTQWKFFRKNRGTTSHTYDEVKAVEVLQTVPVFLDEAKFVLQQLQKRQV